MIHKCLASLIVPLCLVLTAEAGFQGSVAVGVGAHRTRVGVGVGGSCGYSPVVTGHLRSAVGVDYHINTISRSRYQLFTPFTVNTPVYPTYPARLHVYVPPVALPLQYSYTVTAPAPCPPCPPCPQPVEPVVSAPAPTYQPAQVVQAPAPVAAPTPTYDYQPQVAQEQYNAQLPAYSTGDYGARLLGAASYAYDVARVAVLHPRAFLPVCRHRATAVVATHAAYGGAVHSREVTRTRSVTRIH